MTIDELRAVAKTLTFRGLLRQMRMNFVLKPKDDHVLVELHYYAFDATSFRATPAPFSHDDRLSHDDLESFDEAGAVEYFAGRLLVLLMHEIDEGLFVRGKHRRVPAGHGDPFVRALTKEIAKLPRDAREALAASVGA